MSKPQSADEKRSAAEACLPVKMDKKTFVFAVEFERSNDEPTTEETRRQIPTNGVRVWQKIDETMMAKIMPGKYFMLADIWLGIPESPGNIKRSEEEGKPLHVWQDKEVRILRAAMKAHDIQPAVTYASAGDTVLVTNGTYWLTNTISITKIVTLKSVNGRDYTTINGNYPARTNTCISATWAAFASNKATWLCCDI